MDISAATTFDLSPDGAMGKLLQMIKTAGLNKSKAIGKETEGAEDDNEAGNAFLQVLQHKLAELLQSDPSDLSAVAGAKEELSQALEELLGKGRIDGGEILQAFPLLAIAGMMGGIAGIENESLQELSSGSIAETAITGIFEEGVASEVNPMKAALIPEKEETAATGKAEVSADKNAMKQGWAADLPAPDGALNAVIADSAGSDKVKETADASLTGGGSSTGRMSAERQERGLNTDNSGIHLSEQTKKPGDEVGRDALRALTGYPDGQKEAALEGRAPAMPPSLGSEKIVSTQKETAEAQNLKINPMLAGVIQENKSRSKISDEKTAEAETITAETLQGRDMKNKMPLRPEAELAVKSASESSADPQKNTGGKISAIAPEASGLIDKGKSEFKTRTLSAERNAENNGLSPTVLSGVDPGKTSSSDISPADIINRVAAEFNEKLSTEGGRVKITLAPPSLGTLEMDVMVHNSRVRVVLTAENQDVQKVLAGNLDSLKGSLQGQGLTIERCDVMMQDRREQYGQGFNQQAFQQEQSPKQHHDQTESYGSGASMPAASVLAPKRQESWRSGNISIFV